MKFKDVEMRLWSQATGDVVKIVDREDSRCHALLMKQLRSEKYVGFPISELGWLSQQVYDTWTMG